MIEPERTYAEPDPRPIMSWKLGNWFFARRAQRETVEITTEPDGFALGGCGLPRPLGAEELRAVATVCLEAADELDKAR